MNNFVTKFWKLTELLIVNFLELKTRISGIAVLA